VKTKKHCVELMCQIIWQISIIAHLVGSGYIMSTTSIILAGRGQYMST